MGGSMIDALERYELYAQSYDDGVFYDDFGALTSADLRNVVVCQITNEDILWLRNYIETDEIFTSMEKNVDGIIEFIFTIDLNSVL